MKITAKLIKSFTQNPEQGNPAGVVRVADVLSDSQILKATQELGFGESAFLQRSKIADFKLRLFSVTGEVNSCITATIAAAHVVTKELNLSHVSFETRPGVLEVFKRDDGLLLVKQPEVSFITGRYDRKRIATLLSISESALGDTPIELVSAGTPKLLIPIKTLDALFAIQPDLTGIAEYCKEIGGRGFYPFTLETKKPGSDFHARQFNPLDGIAEDPVTGVAAVALTAYFHKHSIITKDRIIGEQGYCINKPGEIIIEGQEGALYVGGYTVGFGEREFEIEG